MVYDWGMGLIGGLLIGTAGALYLLLNGRVMGASGILGGLVDGSAGDSSRERLFFIAGLVVVPGLVVLALGGAETHLSDNMVLVATAGALVGVGTRIGSGCTSGHGVCGISRLSPRGIVSTVVFIGAGAVTVSAARTLIGGV